MGTDADDLNTAIYNGFDQLTESMQASLGELTRQVARLAYVTEALALKTGYGVWATDPCLLCGRRLSTSPVDDTKPCPACREESCGGPPEEDPCQS